MKRSLFACFLALTMTLSLAACGGSSKTDAAYNASASTSLSMSKTEEAFDTIAEAPAEMETENGSVLENQKIIYTGEMNLETTAFDDASTALTDLVSELGGYLQTSTVGSGSRYRWADYTIRVPSKVFQRFLDQAGTLAHVTWQNTDLQNITEAYYDTEGRLKTQQIKLERLQNLLAQAENMEDIITIESAISETEWSIEELSGTLRHYDALVDYATVNVHLSEVYKLSNTEEVPESFGDRMSSAFARGLSAFGDAMEDFAVALTYNWVWVLLWAAVIVGAGALTRKALRRRAARKAAKAAEKSDEKQDDKSKRT